MVCGGPRTQATLVWVECITARPRLLRYTLSIKRKIDWNNDTPVRIVNRLSFLASSKLQRKREASQVPLQEIRGGERLGPFFYSPDENEKVSTMEMANLIDSDRQISDFSCTFLEIIIEWSFNNCHGWWMFFLKFPIKFDTRLCNSTIYLIPLKNIFKVFHTLSQICS